MKQKILALDIATKTGFATEKTSGVWNLTPKNGDSEGMRAFRFQAKLKEIVESEGITLVAYERPAGRHALSIMVASEMIGVMKALCEEKKLNYASYSSKTIKKHATGNGNSGKPAMVASAIEKFKDIKIIDDNHADALWLYNMVSLEINN